MKKDFYPYLDFIFEFFGTGKLVFGSDWPVVLRSGSYTKGKNRLKNYMHNSSQDEKGRVFKKCN
jgi:L-fuconolactonase